ncbi:uncharacterized protein V6R79_003013 [Siganus canaliculatus]
MAESGRPAVYVVDSYASRPPVPPRLSYEQPKRSGVAQTLLFLLVSLALVGMVIEACFIYRLYPSESGTSASFSKITKDKDDIPPTERPSFDVVPSKPAAHLTDGQDVFHASQIMAWSMDADPLLYEMDYKDRSIVIRKEGFYYVYSKISFSVTKSFHHSIDLKTNLYVGKSIPLLISRKYSLHNDVLSNSYLGGVFHLKKDDAIFVKVSNTSKIVRHKSYENIFGAYMI